MQRCLAGSAYACGLGAVWLLLRLRPAAQAPTPERDIAAARVGAPWVDLRRLAESTTALLALPRSPRAERGNLSWQDAAASLLGAYSGCIAKRAGSCSARSPLKCRRALRLGARCTELFLAPFGLAESRNPAPPETLLQDRPSPT
jgi:hypothetical protein